MADDILGHEHLDHGKHLHKGPNAHHHGHAKGGAGHGHHMGGANAHQHVSAHAGTHAAAEHAHANLTKSDVQDKHVGVLGTPKQEVRSWKRSAILVVALLAAAAGLFLIAPALSIGILVVALNALFEQYKYFTEGVPLDAELLTVGTVYLATHGGFAVAICVSVFGPPIAELTRGQISEFFGVKIASLLVASLAAYVFGPAPWQLFTAVIFGLTVQYIGMLLMQQEAIFNLFRRLTNAGFCAYLLFIILPRIIPA